jgi:hypothetical protein
MEGRHDISAVWLRLRSELRARWRSWLGLALLIGLAGGAAVAAAAEARRTETAYPRFIQRTRPSIPAKDEVPGSRTTSIPLSVRPAAHVPS